MNYPVIKYFQFLLTILTIVLFTSTIHSQSTSLDKRLQRKMLNGLDETFKFNFKKSEKIFDKIIKDHPENPAGYHFKSIPYLWRFLDNKSEADKKTFESLSDSVVDKSLKSLEKNPDDPFIYYILGTTYSFRAMAAVRRESYLDVVWATKKSFSYLNQAITIDSTYYDCYLGLGLYNFMVAQTPPALKWAMNITGISGDAETGMDYLMHAKENGVFSKVEADYYLSQILSEFYQDYGKANSILSRLNKKYPKNLLFKYSFALLKIKMKGLKKAENILKRIVQINDTTFNQLISYSNLSIGNIHFFENEYDTAKYFYTNFLSNSTDNYFKGIAALRLGICNLISGDTLSAVNNFKLTDEGNSDIDDDRFASSVGQEYAEVLPDSLQIKFIFIRNLIRCGKYKPAYDSLFSIEDTLISEKNLLAEKDLLLSDVYFNIDSLTKSYNYAVSAANLEGIEKWIKPFSYYYAARSSLSMDDISNAELFINQAKEFNDYYYENDLNNSLNVLDEKIARLKKSNP